VKKSSLAEKFVSRVTR